MSYLTVNSDFQGPASLVYPGGFSTRNWAYEDNEFKTKKPVIYYHIAGKLKETRKSREDRIRRLSEMIFRELKQINLVPEISGRPKHIFSIHQKMCHNHIPFETIHDLNGIRIILPQIQDCYRGLYAVHKIWKPIPSSFDDYISASKKSGYQSLHTTVVCYDSIPLEVQLRTPEMHFKAEYGTAAHWRYKFEKPHDFSETHKQEKYKGTFR